MEVLNRLWAFIRSNKIRLEDIAESIGMTRQGFEYAIKNESVKLVQWEKLKEIDELKPFFEVEPSLTVVQDRKPQYGGDENILVVPVDHNNEELVPLVGFSARASYISRCKEPEFIEELPMLQLYGHQDGTYRAFQIQGDSMTIDGVHGIRENDIVVCKYLQLHHWKSPGRKIREGQLFVIVTNENILFKKISKHDLSTGLITCSSFNEYDDDFTIHIDDIKELWYYKGYYSTRSFV